ncbi:hypothetical protein GF312_13390 [Candidatus Poribacteria bacterium]|nr:hypothetical protein [Candidatus Poribacteria bacterium]
MICCGFKIYNRIFDLEDDKLTKIVKQFNIVKGLRKLHLKTGDIAFIHSSLKSFGYVEGGAETVIKALLEVLGDDGTLVVPIFRRYFWDGPDQVWDRDNSSSFMGIISEKVRTWPGSERSHHAPHPVAAVGRLAKDITDRYNKTDFAPDSPFARMMELNAWIIMIGVDYNTCTMIHLVEEKLQVPYRRWIMLPGIVIEDGVSERRSYPFYARYPGVNCDFIPMGRRMEKQGLVNSVKVGKSKILAFHSRDLYDSVTKALKEDPLFLVSSDTKEEASKYIK